MSLPPEEREEMAEALTASLPRDLALEATIERRYEELRAGKVKGIPAEDVIEELEKLVR
jgi:putative addiction module component (TIGR02574 family)